MKVSFYTLGCKVNQYETSVMEDDFRSYGYEIVPFGQESDVTVIHTCAVTHESARKSLQMVRKAKRISPQCIAVAVGCVSQTVAECELSDADVIVGSKGKRLVPKLVGEYIINRRRVIHVSDMTHENEFEDMVIDRGDRTRAQIKIQDGCNNFCSYCIIPYARGRIRSKDIDIAFAEAEGMVKNGYKEIVLSGIHLDSYGREHGRFDLIDLLEKIDKIPGIERIRLGSLEPLFINPRNTDRMLGIKHLCRHFHLSLQSGSDDVLKAMNRHYSSSEYANAVGLLKRVFDTVSVTTDIITGFPGETEDNHIESLNFAKSIGFSKIHVFPFSPRQGTVAYGMADRISADIKKRRTEEMLTVARESEQKFLNSLIGKTDKVLFENVRDGLFAGLTPGYAEVRVKTGSDISNQIKNVIITSVHNDYCLGECVE